MKISSNEIVVSIIIPVFNTDEKLVKRCLESIVQQTFEGLEILIIDDGSKEECSAYLDKLQKMDKRIQIYHKLREGVSSARNYGVQKAVGEYIMFVDSDDFVRNIAVGHAVEAAKVTNAEFIIGAVKTTGSDFKVPIPNTSKEKFTYEVFGIEDFSIFRAHFLDMSYIKFRKIEGGNITRGPCARLVKREVVIQNEFPKDISIGEDTIWNEKMLNYIKRICIVYENWYYYVENPLSQTRRLDLEIIGKMEDKLNRIYLEIVVDNPYLEKHFEDLLCEEVISYIVKRQLLHKSNKIKYKEKRKYLMEIMKIEPFHKLLSCPISKNKTGIKILLLRLGMVIPVYRLKLIVDNWGR